MSEAKELGSKHKPKIMSFVGAGPEVNGINFEGQPISELETDLPTVETQLDKGASHQQTPP